MAGGFRVARVHTWELRASDVLSHLSAFGRPNFFCTKRILRVRKANMSSGSTSWLCSWCRCSRPRAQKDLTLGSFTLLKFRLHL